MIIFTSCYINFIRKFYIFLSSALNSMYHTDLKNYFLLDLKVLIKDAIKLVLFYKNKKYIMKKED